jgi:hypothetical protein
VAQRFIRTEFTVQAIVIGVSDIGGGDWVGWAILIAIFGLIALDLFGNVRARLRSRLAKRRWSRYQVPGPPLPDDAAQPQVVDWADHQRPEPRREI